MCDLIFTHILSESSTSDLCHSVKCRVDRKFLGKGREVPNAEKQKFSAKIFFVEKKRKFRNEIKSFFPQKN
jgi:hypothetical protein